MRAHWDLTLEVGWVFGNLFGIPRRCVRRASREPVKVVYRDVILIGAGERCFSSRAVLNTDRTPASPSFLHETAAAPARPSRPCWL